ncbi:MAG: NAD-dependent epimerase/dehydratase family protein [Tatlockia sp.]|nr:NAD-dependent epimerase/dehydratase family protein [Tatlockia sp.]
MKANPLSKDLTHIYDKTFFLWDELREQRIFITGGTGFFGCWLLESFLWMNDVLNLNAKATILTRNIDNFANKYPHLYHQTSLSFCEGDVKGFEFPAGKFSHIIHAATDTNTSLNNENPLGLFATISEGTAHMFEFAKHAQAKKFLLTSSGAVYGKQPENLSHLPETYLPQLHLFDSKSTYALGKCAAEHLSYLQARHSGLDIKIARCFAFVGPYLPLDGHYAIGNFISDGLKANPIQVKGDGTPLRSYLYAADLAVWLWTILFSGKSLHPYNVGSDEAYSIAEIAYLVANSYETPLIVNILEEKKSGAPIERYVPNIQRAKAELNLKPYKKLMDAIKSTKEWCLQS